MADVPHRSSPCANCPWRTDSVAGEFPAERYETLRDTSGGPGKEVPIGGPVFACHKSTEGHDRACAGWLAVEGWGHLGMRLAVIEGRLPYSALHVDDTWPELFGSYDQLAERNGA
jgi:hypothetical protein